MASTVKKILIIDDEADIRDTLEMALGFGGYEVEAVKGGQEALEVVRQRSFDLIICDYRMPGMDGVETLEALKKLAPWVPVVLVSGFLSDENRENCISSGAFELMNKPFSLSELYSVIGRAADAA